MTSPFEIEILRTWQDCPDPIHDSCLSGALRVTINGTVVADDEGFGVAESARVLLRTIERDHDAANRIMFTSYLLCHDCGFPDFACSNFGTTWVVRHRNGFVHISEVENYNSHPTVRHLRFPGAETDIPLEDYRREVVRFAVEARSAYFASGEREIRDPDERGLYEEFWREFDELLARHGSGVAS